MDKVEQQEYALKLIQRYGLDIEYGLYEPQLEEKPLQRMTSLATLALGGGFNLIDPEMKDRGPLQWRSCERPESAGNAGIGLLQRWYGLFLGDDLLAYLMERPSQISATEMPHEDQSPPTLVNRYWWSSADVSTRCDARSNRRQSREVCQLDATMAVLERLIRI